MRKRGEESGQLVIVLAFPGSLGEMQNLRLQTVSPESVSVIL